MPKPKVQKDSRVVYYAEGGASPYKGPFPALVEQVYPPEKGKENEPPPVDLRVYFNGLEGQAHLKTNVKYAVEPTKHCWGDLPLDWKWPAEVAAASSTEPEATAK